MRKDIWFKNQPHTRCLLQAEFDQNILAVSILWQAAKYYTYKTLVDRDIAGICHAHFRRALPHAPQSYVWPDLYWGRISAMRRGS